MTTIVISQPTLFPWAGMLEQLLLADVYVHYDDVQYSKGWFTNRVQLKTLAGQKWMTIPLRELHFGDLISQVHVDDATQWRSAHERQFTAAYAAAPFFEQALAILQECYQLQTDLLTGLVTHGLEAITKVILGSQAPKFLTSSELGVGGKSSDRVLQIVQELGGNVYVTGHGAKNYMDHKAFESAGIDVQYMVYGTKPYPQLHGEFTPYVSSLDLIANVGDASGSYLAPSTVDWRTALIEHAELTE